MIKESILIFCALVGACLAQTQPLPFQLTPTRAPGLPNNYYYNPQFGWNGANRWGWGQQQQQRPGSGVGGYWAWGPTGWTWVNPLPSGWGWGWGNNLTPPAGK